MKNSIFVIQKHHSSTLHYDFRLQIGDVLKSWVIPKGPSLNPKDKRLAILAEDHELSFATFEGEIPAGEYGAGKIIVWDHGYYENTTTDDDKKISMQQAFNNGKITFRLYGKKLKGNFSLVSFKGQVKSKNWLLIKQNNSEADTGFNPLIELPNSVISNKGIEEI